MAPQKERREGMEFFTDVDEVEGELEEDGLFLIPPMMGIGRRKTQGERGRHGKREPELPHQSRRWSFLFTPS